VNLVQLLLERTAQTRTIASRDIPVQQEQDGQEHETFEGPSDQVFAHLSPQLGSKRRATALLNMR
jgi:hypothetical protein